MRAALISAIVLATAACAPTPEKLSELRSGITTAEQALAALGTPERDEVLPDGSRMMVWNAQSSRTRAVNFVPGPAHVWGGWNVREGEAAAMFDPDGRLRFHSWSGDGFKQMRNVGRTANPQPPPAPQDEE